MASRKSSSSSSSGGESGTGMVVSLVLFVILTIALGVTTYLGYSGQSDLQAKAKEADGKATTANQGKEVAETQLATVRIATGVDTEADRQYFSGRKASQTAKINEQLAALKGIKWDIQSQANRPTQNYLDMLGATNQALKAATDAQKARENDLAVARKQFEDDKKDLNDKLKAAEKKNAELNTQLLAAQQIRHGGADTASKTTAELREQVAQLMLKIQNDDVEKSREINKLKEKIDSMTKVRENLLARVGPITDKIAALVESRPDMRDIAELHDLLVKHFDKAGQISNDIPKGQVVRINRDQELVYVNLGSADYIRPQVSFSVMPAGSTGKSAAAKQRKGALEIVSVLEAHLSTAKIVEEASRYRDPIMPGDLLFNPAWNRNQREHVAITGIVDLNGDGLDDTQDLIRALEKQGVEVDAYLDLKSRTVKGAGITEKTTYLIIGERPQLPQSILASEGNALGEAARDVLARMTEMENKAKDMGVTKVQYRKFLSLVGFRIPKGTAEINASTYLRGTGTIKPTESEDRPR